jgi:hypothetical protein
VGIVRVILTLAVFSCLVEWEIKSRAHGWCDSVMDGKKALMHLPKHRYIQVLMEKAALLGL